MDVSRRSFLIGSTGALVMATTFTPSLAKILGPIDHIVKTTIPQRHRKVYDILLSSNASVDDVVEYTIARDDSILFQMAMNARASYRWVAAPKSELIFPSTTAFNFIVANKGPSGNESKPAHETSRLMLYCEDEYGKCWAEAYQWKCGKNKLIERSPLYYEPLTSQI